MALPAFVSTKHHVGLGAPGSEVGLMLSSYVKRSQDSPLQRVHQGNDDFLGTNRESSWTQDDFSGGNYQAEFRDPAMFALSRGVLPTQQSAAGRACPGLIKAKMVTGMGNAGADISATLTSGKRPLFAGQAGGQAIFGFDNRIVRCTVTAAGVVTTSVDTHGVSKTCYHMEPITGTLYAGASDGKIYTFNPTTLALVATINAVAVGGGAITGTPTMIHVWGDMLFVAWGTSAGSRLYVQTETGQFQQVGAAKGSKSPTAGRLPGNPVAACPYNGQLYILVRRQTGLEGVICATTGTQLSTVASIPFAVDVQCMSQYAGRLYIGAVGYDLDGNDGHGELYELTGNALRLVKSWQRNKQMATSFLDSIYSMDVVDGLLAFPNQSQRGVEIYDASQDAFFTGPCIELDSTMTTFAFGVIPWSVVALRDQLLVWCQTATNADRGIYKIRQVSDGVPTHQGMGGVIQTSDFGPEPARKKRWGQVAVRTRGSDCKALYYSIDGGAAWTLVPQAGVVNQGELYTTLFNLGALASPGYRIRLRFSLWSATMFTQTIELAAFTLHFSFLETGRHGFQLGIIGALNIQCPDGTVYTGTPLELRQALWTWADTGAVLQFIDRDGVAYPVHVTQPTESEPVLNDRTNRESFLNCYLLEM